MEDIERLASLEVGTKDSHGKNNRVRFRSEERGQERSQEHQIISAAEPNKVSV